jgi:hypothetical protein
MTTKLFSLAVAVLGTPILAHAFPPTLPNAACTHAPLAIIGWANAVLVALGFPPICF